MTDNHPITLPPEMVQQWAGMRPKNDAVEQNWIEIATRAARWGADQELEACCEWITERRLWEWASHDLRAARRPKPPSLAEEALKALDHLCVNHPKATDQEKTILRAIKRLQELEGAS